MQATAAPARWRGSGSMRRPGSLTFGQEGSFISRDGADLQCVFARGACSPRALARQGPGHYVCAAMKKVRDFGAELRHAVEEARRAGLLEEASALEDALNAACTTSSELLGVQGEAIVRFLRSTRGRLPAGARSTLEDCLKEIGTVWPRLRRWR